MCCTSARGPGGDLLLLLPRPPDLVAVGRRLRRADELWGDEPDGRWRKGSRGGGSRGPGEVYEFDGVQSGLGGEMEDSGMGWGWERERKNTEQRK